MMQLRMSWAVDPETHVSLSSYSLVSCVTQQAFFVFQDLANGQYDILFYPTMAIPHKLDIKYNGLPVTASPMEAKV